MSHQGKAAGKGPKKDRKPKPKNGSKPGDAKLAGDLKKRVGAMIDALVNEDRETANETFEHMLTRAGDLFRRKQAMEGTKSETRDLIGEVMFTRLRRAFREFLSSDDAASEIKCAEWAMGLLYSGAALQEFAAALDRAILETSRPMDYSFAGRADFISVEEVLQLLGSGNYTGMLGIEKDDNRLDIYLHKGRIVFLDPHHLIRRILPSDDSMNYKEISEDLLRKAEALHAKKDLPLIMGLVELNLFKPKEIPELVRTFGLEVLFEFLRDPGACSFFYRKSEDLPDFAKKHRLNLAVTPILLEGSKQMDDWISMLKVFPDPTAPVEPVPDMFARINSLDLDVVEIRLLAMINGETSPKALAPAIGLPLVDVYQALIGFARDGVLVAPGGLEALHEITFSVEESMERAFEALDANDDQMARASALDAALGGGEPGRGDDDADHADHVDGGDDGILARLGVGKRVRKDG
ncbi:MAG: DUF4388 domain-containing protein [Planctomycetota bacterium]|jgi:hypothetical protein